MAKFVAACAWIVLLALAAAAFGAPASPVFYKTQDSDEWVARTFIVQPKYERVLVVTASGEPPKSVIVPRLDLNARGGGPEAQEYPVAAAFKTLQAAADAARGGDLVVVTPGTYAGFALQDKPDAGDGKYICFKALGKPGEVTIDCPAEGKDRNWMVMFQSAHHAILEGFNIAGKTGPGLEQVGPQAGIFIDGNFGPSGKMAHHIALVANFSHNHRGWGFHSTDSHTVLVQDNLFALSCREHSAYVSDGSDNYVIRRNVFFASTASGLQCNLDPTASFEELFRNEAFASYPAEGTTREWAQGLLKLAAEKFGENNFPDGRGLNFIIEDNVVYGNGKSGGGSFNFAGLQDSLIQNNLIYENLTTGIAAWDNANPYDAALASPGPSAPGDVKGPDVLPFWGCYRNVIRNNTVIMDNPGRVAMLLNNGSWGSVLRNNIFLNDQSNSMEVSNTSIWKLDSGYNVIRTADIPGALKTLAVALDEANHSAVGVTRDKAAAEFVKWGSEPWVVIEGNWWKLNPNRPDFRPKAGSKLLAGQGDAKNVPPKDIDGRPRTAADIGAYRAAQAETK